MATHTLNRQLRCLGKALGTVANSPINQYLPSCPGGVDAAATGPPFLIPLGLPAPSRCNARRASSVAFMLSTGEFSGRSMSSFLIPHSSFLIPHSSFLIPHSSFLIPLYSYLHQTDIHLRQNDIFNIKTSGFSLTRGRGICYTLIIEIKYTGRLSSWIKRFLAPFFRATAPSS